MGIMKRKFIKGEMSYIFRLENIDLPSFGI